MYSCFSHQIKQKILFRDGVSNKSWLILIQKLPTFLGEVMCAALSALCDFSGSDSGSTFVWRGKQITLKTPKKSYSRLNNLLKYWASFLTVWNILYAFATWNAYHLQILSLQYIKFAQHFKAKNGKPLSSYNITDMSVLQLSRDLLKQHIKRSMYQALIWYWRDQTIQRIPQPDGHTWERNECLPIKRMEVDWFLRN